MKIGTRRLSSHIKFIKDNKLEISEISLNYYINKNNLSPEMGKRIFNFFKI